VCCMGWKRLDLKVASKVLLLGAGPIGLLLLQGLRLNGAAELVVVDKKSRPGCPGSKPGSLTAA